MVIGRTIHRFRRFRLLSASGDKLRELTVGGTASDAEPIRVHLCPQTLAECHEDGLLLVLSGDVAAGCLLERSNDLIHWSPVPSGDAAVIGDEILVPVTAEFPSQFYRARPSP